MLVEQTHARAVDALRNHEPGGVTTAPAETHGATGIPSVRHQAANDTIARVDDLEIEDVGLAQAKGDLGAIGLAPADRREHLRDLGAEDRARGQLERLRVGEREPRGYEQSRNEGGWCVSSQLAADCRSPRRAARQAYFTK